MLEAKGTKCLPDYLKQLAEAGKTDDFKFDPDIDSLPAGERETAFLLKKVLDNFKSAAEYDLMRYRLTGESLGVGYWDMTITGNDAASPDNQVIWSPELCRMLGYSHDSGSGDFSNTSANWLEHLHPDDRDKAVEAFAAHTADRTGKTQFVTEYRLKKASGEYISVRAFGTALRDNTGVPIRIAGAVEEITEIKRMRDILIQREKTLDILNRVALVLLAREEKSFGEAMTESLGLIAGIADIDRMSVFRNSEKPDGRYLSQIYRWRNDANGTVDVWKELNDVPYARIVPQLEPILASGKSIGGHVNSLQGCEAFKRFGCETILAVPMFDDGKFWGAALFERLNDKIFTEQETEVLRSASFMLSNAVVRNEEAAIVRQADEQSRLMLDAAPLAVTMWDRNFNLIDCSQNTLEVFGFPTKQKMKEEFLTLAPEYQPCGRRSIDVLAEEVKKTFETGYTRLEWTHMSTGGDVLLFDVIAKRIKHKDDYALILYPRDIREEKKMLAGLRARDEMLVSQAETIRHANEQTQTMLDAIPVSITIWGRDRNVLECSQYAVDMFGYSNKQELIEQLADHMPEYQSCGKKSAELLADSSAEAFSTGYSRIEWTQLTTGGEPILLDAQAIRIKYRGDYALMLFSRDIREDKKMLKELAERDEMLAAQAHWYKSLLDGVPLPISVTDAGMKLTFTNTAAENAFGRSREELIGLPCSIWKTPICGTVDCSIVRAREGQKQSYFKFGDMSCKVDTEIIRDIAGETIGFLEILHDITEVENLARQQAESAKSAFLAQMNRDMRTPMSTIVGLSELVLKNGGLSRDNEIYLDKIYNVGSILLDAVNDILDISQTEAAKHASAVRNEEMMTNMPGAIWQCVNNPPEYTITYVSPGIHALTGYTPEELIGGSMAKLFKLMHSDDVPQSLKLRGETLRKGLPMETYFRITPKNGGEKWIWERSKAAKTAPDGRPELFEGFYTDITDQRHREVADAANEAKSAFLAQMSHEMRTPLSAVIGLSELVLENGGLSQDNEVYLDKIYNAGSTLLGIVNDILDISKIEAGKFEIVPQEYDVPSLINDTITQNILRIHSKPVRFTLDLNENVPVRLRGDDIRVKQILSNLLSNAFKYTDEGKVELSIDYEREGDSVWTTFRVSDTGVGIKSEDTSRLFTDYARFDGATNRKIGGTGLGLSITKRLVELMGGNITATSEYGKGSVFTVKIRQQFVSESVIGIEMAEHLREFQYTTGKRRRGSQLHRVRIPHVRVLVVDDNKTNLDIAQGLMRPYGMDIDCVTGGQAAIDAIREGNKYAAVFMDHMMPGMDGMEAVRIIREEIGSEYAKTVPIIALTANALAGSKERFISQGFNAFVSKPIDIFRLDSVIRKWIWEKNNDNRQDDDSRVFVKRRKKQDRRKGGDRRKGDRRNSALIPALSEVIEGLDWMKGIELFGDAGSFRQILRSFAVNTGPLLDSVFEVSKETLPQYAITVHGIKSSSRGVCAHALGSVAESLEFAAKDGNLDFVSLHNPDFLTAARKLITDIETLLDKTEKTSGKPVKDKPDDAELARLCTACENFNMDEIETVMREIDSCEYTADNGLAEWLRDNIAKLNYSQVIEKIAQATKEV